MFTRENTKQIKGIAILMMLAHHLFVFPDKIPYGMSLATSFSISGKELVTLIGQFCNICVSIYLFMGGYGLYKKAVVEDEALTIRNGLGKDVWNLYRSYWKVFFVFVPIGFLFFANQVQYCANQAVCYRFSEWSLENFLMNLVGMSYSYNSEWWFLWSYIFALFVGYIFIELFRGKRKLYSECGAVILWAILLADVFPIFPFYEGYEALWSNIWYKNIFLGSEYTIVALIGIVFAKYHIFENWKKELAKLKTGERIIGGLLAIVLIAYVRVFFVNNMFEIVLIPLFVFACHILIEAVEFIKKPLEFLGKHSTNMWLVHTFYCFYFGITAKLVYASNNAIVALVTLTALSLGTSIVLELFWGAVAKLYRGIWKR